MWISFLKKIWMVRKPAISLWNKKQIVMTRKEAATIMTQTFPLAKTWWESPKHEKAWKQFVEAKKIYKEWIEKKN
jgi:hypothetical protein